MAGTLPSPAMLRGEAHRHRDEARKAADAEQRRVRLAVAHEYEKLARVIEAEPVFAQPGRDHVAP